MSRRNNPRRGVTSYFDTSALNNNWTYIQYYNRLMEIAMSMFEWKNLPDTVDPRFLEMTLLSDGMAVYFNDDIMGNLALQVMIGGQLNVYRIPTYRRAYATNGYQMPLDETNSVIIFNNFLHTNALLDLEMFSKRLYNIDRAIDVNVNAQKTPILIKCAETQRLSMLNLYEKYEGNEPVIFGDKELNTDSLQVLKTDAPYMADKLFQLKSDIWNEALTYLGISNLQVNKRERLITDEVSRSQGGTIASRYSRLEMRRQACDEINRMFGTNISVDVRKDLMENHDEGGEGDGEVYNTGQDNS